MIFLPPRGWSSKSVAGPPSRGSLFRIPASAIRRALGRARDSMVRGHWFQPDKLAINPSTPRVISEVEDMIEVLAGAFRRMWAKVG